MFSLLVLYGFVTLPSHLLGESLMYAVGRSHPLPDVSVLWWKHLKFAAAMRLSRYALLRDMAIIAQPLVAVLKGVRKQFPAFVESLPGYGEEFTAQPPLLWLVKQPDACHDDPVVLYLHGGGYTMAIMAEQVLGMAAVHHALAPHVRDRTSVVILDYSISSKGHHWPVQLEEAMAVYERLVAAGHTRIILLGDLAGGHLALTTARSLVGHAQPPHALVLVSPWVELDYEPSASTAANEHTDLIPYFGWAPQNANYVLVDGERERWPEVMRLTRVPRTEWARVLAIAEGRVFLVAGTGEVFYDQIQRFCAVAGIPGVFEPRGVHDALFFVDPVLRQLPLEVAACFSTRRVADWLSQLSLHASHL